MEDSKENCRRKLSEYECAGLQIKSLTNAKEGKALPLINYDDDGFRVSEEAAEFLSSIKEKIGVIVVAGKYRTGKSFLLNRIIMNKIGEGFGVGPTINPCTKGLWVWNEVFEAEYNDEKFKVIIVDSEGIEEIHSTPLQTYI